MSINAKRLSAMMLAGGALFGGAAFVTSTAVSSASWNATAGFDNGTVASGSWAFAGGQNWTTRVVNTSDGTTNTACFSQEGQLLSDPACTFIAESEPVTFRIAGDNMKATIDTNNAGLSYQYNDGSGWSSFTPGSTTWSGSKTLQVRVVYSRQLAAADGNVDPSTPVTVSAPSGVVLTARQVGA